MRLRAPKMDCSYQLPREHRGLREELGITDVTLGPELAIRTKGVCQTTI
jgi:hypothetical protein